MENLTHSLLGAALAKTRLGQMSPFAPAALVVAANLPDFENFILAFCDKPTNMIHHRSVTHAVVGVIALAPLLALLVRGLEHCFARAGPRGSFWGLFAGVFLATASHPLLDWLNTYGLRPWLPFDTTRYHGDLVFILDPWLWLILGGTVCLAGKRTLVGSISLAILALLAGAFVSISGVHAPLALHVAFPLAVLAFVIGRHLGFGRRHAHAVVAAGLGLATAYVGFLGWSGHRAWQLSQPIVAAQLPPGETIISHTTSPVLANPLRWQITAETPDAVYRHGILITRPPGGPIRLAKRLQNPLVEQATDSSEGRAWRIFARHPVAAIAANGDGYRVYLMDARYAIFPAHGFSSVTVDVPAKGRGRRMGP